MNYSQSVEILRQLLTMGGTYFVAQGVMTNNQESAIVSGIIALFSVAWGVYSRRQNGLIKATAALPAVDKVVVHDAQTEKEVASPSVVAK